MIYTTTEKRKMGNILTAFQDYIQAHPDFDILYSDKVGYIQVPAKDPEGESVVSIRAADRLLDVLFSDIIDDVRFSDSKKQHYSAALDDDEMKEVQSRITAILKKLGEEADYCLDFLRTFLEEYPDNDIEG